MDWEEYHDLLGEIQEMDGFARWCVICELVSSSSVRDVAAAIAVVKKEGLA